MKIVDPQVQKNQTRMDPYPKYIDIVWSLLLQVIA